MKVEKVVASTVLAVGIVLGGLLVMNGLKGFRSNERVVTVKGLSERQVEANRVLWPIVLKGVGNDLINVNDDLMSKSAKVTAFLLANGLKKEEITVSAPEIVDLRAERYGAQNVPYNYNVTLVVMVQSDNVTTVRGLILRQTELVRQGIAIASGDYNSRVNYQFTKLNDIKPEMIEEATANARQSGEKFAADSQSRLGKIKTANQGQFSIVDQSEAMPHQKVVRVVTTVDYYLRD